MHNEAGAPPTVFSMSLTARWIKSPDPAQYPLYDFGTRRMALRRFPFVIVFREAGGGVDIIAVARGRRRPGYWRDRPG